MLTPIRNVIKNYEMDALMDEMHRKHIFEF